MAGWWRNVVGCCRSLLTASLPQLRSPLSPSGPRHASSPPLGATTSPSLTSSEVLKALRPFYLAVHPDLFSRFPEEKVANEESLKQLNSYIDVLQTSRRPQPVHLQFYLHPSNRDQERQAVRLRLVNVCLNACSVGSLVHDLLKSCDLSAQVSGSTKKKLAEIKASDEQIRLRKLWTPQPPKVADPFQDWDDYEDYFTRRSENKSKPVYLDSWLLENLPKAKEYLEASRQTREDNVALIRNLCSRFTLGGILIDSDWTSATLRGHLQSLQKLLEQEKAGIEELGPELTLVLGYSNGSRVELNGYTYLNCEDTVHQWAKLTALEKNQKYPKTFLSSAKTLLKSIGALRLLERELSEQLGGVVIERPPCVPSEVYRRWLKEFCVECRGRLDAVLSSVMLETKLVLTGSREKLPSLTESGSILVPVSCPVHSLIAFTKTSHYKAKQLARKYERQKKLTSESLEQCRKGLGLSKLTRNQVVTDSQVQESCRELLKLGSSSHRNMLEGHHFCLSAYYSVTPDGYVRIPWNCVFSNCS